MLAVQSHGSLCRYSAWSGFLKFIGFTWVFVSFKITFWIFHTKKYLTSLFLYHFWTFLSVDNLLVCFLLTSLDKREGAGGWDQHPLLVGWVPPSVSGRQLSSNQWACDSSHPRHLRWLVCFQSHVLLVQLGTPLGWPVHQKCVCEVQALSIPILGKRIL